MLVARDIGVDLGTANILIYVKGRGIVLREPSVVAMERDTGRVLAIGEEAKRMLGRTPGNIIATRPLREGVIADYDITEAMLKHFIHRVTPHRFFFSKPNIMICIPVGITTVERRAVLEAALEAGAKKASLIEEPLAAALGAGLDITRPNGNMVVDIGGGTSDLAVLSLGGVVLSDSLRVGGDKFDDAIVRYVKKEYNLLIGERSAEELKIGIGTAYPLKVDGDTMEIRGRDLLTGLPKNVRITARETHEALLEPVTAIVDAIKSVLERTPPELAADIVDHGLVLTGGGAMLSGLDKLVAEETGIPAHLAEDPMSCVALGTGKALEDFEAMQDHLIVLRKVM
ncbi:MAG: rod shape-determining protein MreB [Symbiobacteriia bacterium]